MFGSMIQRCQQHAQMRDLLGAEHFVTVGLSKSLPGNCELPYGPSTKVDYADVEQRVIAHHWIAPQDRAVFPQDDSIETSEREARG